MRAMLRTACGATKIAEVSDQKPSKVVIDIQLSVDPQRLIAEPDLTTNVKRTFELVGEMPIYQEISTI